ncbi:hypothetical protein BCR36DRAFT_293278 [Piromyces finnis]|uniref:Uncharacterized protein n=1 Tax=Piromyces finnis TaxID=1754191 RepID=A0A1Y1V7W4_9FUNG|nr:hypothetical protein BCR36DRAFT_293278 [Piromyces finnis]|eukprot:ORX48691.1 hypothetical protein BCR36DRAFT_293278 [Piromyces finnis]
MKFKNKLLLIPLVFCKLKCIFSNKITSNFVFYGRGQRNLPKYWNKNVKGSNDADIYFPSSDIDFSLNNNENDNAELIDNVSNYPLVLYLPGKEDKSFSFLDFSIDLSDFPIKLTSLHKLKSEMKLVVPKVADLIKKGYTCQTIGLSCTNLNNYNFEKNIQEWLSKVDLRFYLEFERSDDSYNEGESETKYFSYQIENLSSPTADWSEVIGEIDKDKIKNLYYDDYNYFHFTFRNYGTMPVYVFIGNSIFLQKEPTIMVKNGIIQNDFSNCSWKKDTITGDTYFGDQVCPEDPEKKNSVKFVSKTDKDYGYYAILKNNISVAPPEGISIKIRSMKTNKFILAIGDKKEFNLIPDYLIHRNCDIPIGEEIEFLIDIRSLVYSNSKSILTNDITSFHFMSSSPIEDIKKSQGQEAADAYEETLYFYDFVLHHTYPEDISKYTNKKLSEEGPECRLALETHEDWSNPEKVNPTNPVISWPDSISLDTISVLKENTITLNYYKYYNRQINECKYVNSLLEKYETTNCCLYDEITCNNNGHIISIKLKYETLIFLYSIYSI